MDRAERAAGRADAAGALLIVGGVFGFLPILGFWMIPLGVAVILLDVTMVRRWQRGRTVRLGGRAFRRGSAAPDRSAPVRPGPHDADHRES